MPKKAASTKPRKRQDMSVATRAKLLKEARRRFTKHGYHGTSLAELCTTMNMTRGALYHHFASKDDLFAAVLQQIDTEVNTELLGIWEAETDKWSALSICCHMYLKLAQRPDVQRISLMEGPVVLGHRFRAIEKLTNINPASEVLKDLMDEGSITAGNPEALAFALNGAVFQAALWMGAQKNKKQAFAEAGHVVQSLLDGLVIV